MLRVSIGMPVYNGELFIREALDSLLAQTFTDFELIISDNASNDRTKPICQDYAAKDNRIRYIRQTKNQGAIENFQFVLDEAVGEYFMWAAYDDLREKDCLDYYLKNIGVGNAFFSSYSIFDFNDSQIKAIYHPPILSGNSNNNKDDMISFLDKICPSMIYGIFRTKLLKTVALKPIDWGDCSLLWKYIQLYGYKTKVSRPMYSAGIHSKYAPKPMNKVFLDPVPFLLDISPSLVKIFGFRGFLVYVKLVLKILVTTIEFNLKLD